MPVHGWTIPLIGALVLGVSACTTPSPTETPPTPAATTATGAPDPTDAPSAPAPVLTQATWNEPSSELIVSGLVGGTVDANTVCVFRFAHDGVELTRETTPEPGPSSLDCGTVYVPSDELGPGEWTIVLAYGAQRSAEAKVEVP